MNPDDEIEQLRWKAAAYDAAQKPDDIAGMLNRDGAEVCEIEAEERDAFSPTSGHRTVSTGTFCVVLTGVSKETAEAITAALKQMEEV